MTTRLDGTDDEEVVAIVGSFNTMVARWPLSRTAVVGDASHELRGPITTLVTERGQVRAWKPG